MERWGWVAVTYAAAMLPAAWLAPVTRARRLLCAAMTMVYAAAAWLVSPIQSPAVQLVVPAVLLLTGYWLPGLIFGPPQPALEAQLMRIDRRVFTRFGIDDRLRRAPRGALEALEACYLSVYIVVGAGAILTAIDGAAPLSRYWTVVLAAELVCYALLPWLRSRPPRALEPPGPHDERALAIRRLNMAILGGASVQANTLPSGHVAGAAAAAAAIALAHPLAGAVLGVLAALIGASAVLGRYHYFVDVLTGAIVALAAVWMVG
jgi:membrane-associated phospholipid phosphatase